MTIVDIGDIRGDVYMLGGIAAKHLLGVAAA